ncbi:hypothetical protein M8J76_008546 [Diaphorina citri]|nr:hypothetical protein M8J75_010100 [Diaphorina citri]KAI5749589.1 hypothetical protein M8J76_008546 [Diaphorina citri]
MEEEQEPTPVVLLPWRKPDPLAPPVNQVNAAFADRYLNHLEQLNLDSPVRGVNLTNIMATVGENNNSVDLIKLMLRSSVNILRIPTHSSKLYQVEKILKNVKLAIEEVSLEECKVVTCAVAIETKGTQLRTGKLSRPSNVGHGDNSYSVEIAQGANIVLTANQLIETKGTVKRLFVDSMELPKRVIPDDIVYIDRNIKLKVVEKENNDVHCTVIRGGKLMDNQLVTVPRVTLNLPVIADRDKHVVDLIVREAVDIIIMSSVTGANSIREMRGMLEDHVDRVLILAKIETLLGMEYMDEIIMESDGVVLNRIQLAVATSVEVTFLAQKMIAARCNKQGKPFLVVGDILPDHNVEEYSDVSIGDMNDVNSIVQDGADVVVLTQSEQAHHRVDILKEILKKTESVLWEKQVFEDLCALACPPLDPAHSIVIACVNAALKCQAVAIIVITCSGYSAKLVSKYRPQCPILAVSSLGYVCRHLNVYRNIRPLHYIRNPQADWSMDVDCRVQFAIQHGMEIGIISPGDPLVLINGWRKGAGFTNIMRVVYAPIT